MTGQYGTDPPDLDDNPDVEHVLARTIYEETWNEFYKWERQECLNTLASLSKDPASDPQPLPEPQPRADLTDDFNFEMFDDEPESESFIVEEFDENEDPMRYSTLEPVEGYKDGRSLPGYPRYNFCTPISQNYTQINDYGLALAFAPFADDPNFPLDGYLGYFASFSWQTDFVDPDLELIQLETAKKLYSEQGFSHAEIDQFNILRKLRIDRSSGLLWDTEQRDIPWWTEERPPIPNEYRARSTDLFADLDRDIRNFCPPLGCLRSFCSTHSNEPYPGLDAKKAKLTSIELRDKCKKPCGVYCFKNIDPEDLLLDAVEWEDDDDVKLMDDVFQIIPDQAPCDLAVICRKKCSEIFAYRCRIFDDEDIANERYEDPQPRLIKPQFVDGSNPHESPSFVTLRPCHHAGPCDQFSCSCHRGGQHCQRSCRCEFDCQIRWKGCRCRSRKACRTGDCRCRRVGRECDPDVCIKCDARGKGKKKNCHNVELQRGKFPVCLVLDLYPSPNLFPHPCHQRIKIQRGSHGLGAFATVAIDEYTTIGEYVGEIVPDDGANHSSVPMIYKHTGLNYMFDLEPQVTLDSIRMGNETRYLNDAKDDPKRNNCDSIVRLVNGDHRIALFTTKRVKAGSELLLDYGPKYWNDDDGGEDLEEQELPDDS